MSTRTKKAAEYLESNPRMIGVLFMVGLLVSQTSVVLGAANQATGGP